MNSLFGTGFHYWVKGGVLLIPIAAAAFLIGYYFFRLDSALKIALSGSAGQEDEAASSLTAGAGPGKFRSGNPFFTGMIEFVLSGLRRGASVPELFAEVEEGVFPAFRRDLVILEALVAAAPLLGLLGTVWGMIETFRELALRTGGSPGQLASGISQALITTQFGLAAALPGVFGLARIRRRIGELESRVASLRAHIYLGLRRAGS